MEQILEKHLSAVEFGEVQNHNNMTVVPLLSSLQAGVSYITMQEALESGAMIITEVSAGGSVPDLKVINSGDFPVLILDGEEVAGAKQNRIINTTILIKVKWEGIIPVSCTEAGRWDYSSPHFSDSKIMMSRKIRAKKMNAVHRNLEAAKEYRADQGEVWDEIECLRAEAKAPPSPTRAMKDIFISKQKSLDEYNKAFTLVEKQQGILVIVGGSVVGLDIVSLDSAYKRLHEKLIRSYAIAAIAEGSTGEPDKPAVELARGFIERAKSCDDKKFDSIGYGFDHRIKGAGIVGSALQFNGDVIHIALFREEDGGSSNINMTSFSRRRRFRM